MPNPVTLADLIGWIESKHNLQAIRFEPATYENNAKFVSVILNAIKIAHNNCSDGTARMIYASSWGQFQMMGFNLYAPGAYQYKKSVIDFCNSQDDQVYQFEHFVSAKGIAYTPLQLGSSPSQRMTFARVYNGAPSYAVSLIDALKFYNVPLVA